MVHGCRVRGDAEMRVAVKADVHQHGDVNDTVVIEELGLMQGMSRVDIAVVNGCLHGYELKSARDSLLRLPRQVEHYSQVMDKATLVVTEGHLGSALPLLPSWWEVLLATPCEGGVQLNMFRTGDVNPNINVRSLAELIWRDEALKLLGVRGMAKGMATKPRSAIWDRLCDAYSSDELGSIVRSLLKKRAGTGHRLPL